MKILTPEQIKDLDEATRLSQKISSLQQMERAAEAFTEIFSNYFTKSTPVKVFAGAGNNGGDGLAIARLLSKEGFQVSVYILQHQKKISADNRRNQEKLRKIKTISVYEISAESNLPDISSQDVVIEAILSIGLKRVVDPDAIYAKVINLINDSGAVVVSVDSPAGMFTERETESIAVEADLTITFDAPKYAMLLPENYVYTGEWKVADLKSDQEFLAEIESKRYLADAESAAEILESNLKQKFDHKGDNGKVLIAAGSKGRYGAAMLSVRAAVYSGSGLVTARVPGEAVDLIHNSVPEAIIDTDGNQQLQTFNNISGFDAIAIGPGIGKSKSANEAVEQLLEKADLNSKLVIDADAINILAKNKQLLEMLPPFSILTPHPKEFERLAGKARNDFHRIEMLQGFAAVHDAFVVLKGAHTAIAAPDGSIYFNNSGNPGMAVAGMGDVLTGIIVSLLGQGFSHLDSCVLGVYLHGAAGDLAAESHSQFSLTPSNLINHLGEAFLSLE